jgi:lipid II:glycine glycyltransferase (peptidoglycan interpeptide bridge formation enzyme)
MKVVTTNTIDPSMWDQFVERHPLGTIYHHSLWQDVIQRTYGYKPFYHLILRDGSEIEAAISSLHVRSWLTGNRIVSYPFSDTCDPLVETSEQLYALLKALEKTRSELNARFVELRFATANRLIDNYPSHPEYHNYHLALDKEPMVVFRTFHKSCIQRAIKKARKEELQIFTGKNELDLKTFYRLHLMTRKKHGVPIQPFQFFKGLWNALTPKDMLTLFLARYRNKVVAGIIVLWFKGIARYKFGASDDRFSHLRANQLLMWKAIQSACQNRCKVFDFGRTSTVNQGLAMYKARWGTMREPLYYLRIPISGGNRILNESSNVHAVLKKVMARMPTLVIRLSGDFLYKYLA